MLFADRTSAATLRANQLRLYCRPSRAVRARTRSCRRGCNRISPRITLSLGAGDHRRFARMILRMRRWSSPLTYQVRRLPAPEYHELSGTAFPLSAATT